MKEFVLDLETMANGNSKSNMPCYNHQNIFTLYIHSKSKSNQNLEAYFSIIISFKIKILNDLKSQNIYYHFSYTSFSHYYKNNYFYKL